MAFTFCFFNAIMINRSIFYYIDYESNFWIYYIFGITTFLCGMFINIYSDYSMIKQRKKNKDQSIGSKYIIPRGFMYELISCPNYFGELTEWLGFFVLSNSFNGLVFFVSTFANLFPRALQYHEWYKNKFKEEFSNDEELASRKAIIPFMI